MTSPPAHLLPLALEAMHSADACEVLGDALIESEWWDRRIRDMLMPIGFPFGWGLAHGERQRLDAIMRRHPQPLDARAIAAVLLFGSWSEERWPLVEAHSWYIGSSLEDDGVPR